MTTSTYTPEIGAKFCAALADGKSIRTVCKQAGMPSKATVFRWLREHPEFLQIYEIATDERADTYADEMVAIADACKKDPDSIRKARLQVYARERQLQLTKPRKYGLKLQHMGEGGGPVKVSIKDYTGRKKDSDVPAD